MTWFDVLVRHDVHKWLHVWPLNGVRKTWLCY